MGKREWMNCLSRLVDVYWNLSHAGYKNEAKKVENIMKFVDDRLEYCGRFGAMKQDKESKEESESASDAKGDR